MNLKPTIIKLISRVLLCSFSVGIFFETALVTARTVNKTAKKPVFTSAAVPVSTLQPVSVAALQQRTNMLTILSTVLNNYVATATKPTPGHLPIVGAGAGVWAVLQAAVSTGDLLPGGQNLPSFKLPNGTVIPASNPADPKTLFGLLGKQLCGYSYAGLYNIFASYPKSGLPALDPNYSMLAALMYFGDGSAVDVAAYGYPGNNDQLPPAGNLADQAVFPIASFFQPSAPASVAKYGFQPASTNNQYPNFEQDLKGGLRSGILKKTGHFCHDLDSTYGTPNTVITVDTSAAGTGAAPIQTTLGAYLNPGCSGTACAIGTAWLGATCVTHDDCCQNAAGQAAGVGASGGVAPVVGSIECKFPVAQFPYGTTGFPDPQDLAGQTMIPYGICDLKVCDAVAGGACDANNNNCCPSGTTPTFAGPAINQTCTCVVPTPPPGPTCALFQGSCSPSAGAADVAQTCCAAQNLACDISLNQCLGGLNYICQTGSDCATGYICNSSQKCEPTGCNLNLTPIAPTQACSPTANGACCASVTATEATIANPETHYVCGLSSATVGQAGYNTHVCCVEGGLNNASNNTYVQSAAECCQGSVYTAVPATNGYICVNANNPAPLPTPTPTDAPAPAHGMSSGLEWGLIGGAAALVATGIVGYYITRRNGQLDLVAERDAYDKNFGNMLLDGRTVAEYTAAQQSGGRGVWVDSRMMDSLRSSFGTMCSTGSQFSAELLAAPHSLSLGATAGGDNCPNADEDLSVAVTVAPDGTQTVGAAGPIPAEVLAVINNSGGGSGGAPSFTAATAGLYDGVLEQLKANSNFFNSDGTPKFSIAKVGNGVPGEDILLADTDHLMLKACEIDGLLNPGKTPGAIIADLAGATGIFDTGDIVLLASAGGNTPAARAIGQAIATKGVGRMITVPANLKFAITLADLAKTPALAAQIAALQTEFDASFEEAYWTLRQNLTDGAGNSLIPDPTVADFPPAGFTDLPDLD